MDLRAEPKVLTAPVIEKERYFSESRSCYRRCLFNWLSF
jgi:hypothetical protein